MKQIKKIAITNEKGGVGKTMTAVNLSACLAQRGYRVLLIDADPQGYATLNYDVDVSPSLLEVLRGQVACTKAVQTTRFGVDVLPSDRTLSVIEEDLIRQKMNGAPYLNTLEKALEDLPDYDFVIIDCPPQGGRLMDIVHYYADAIIMPMFAEDYGIHALTLKAEAIADIRRTINPNLKILGGLITMDERRGLRSVFREVLLGQDLLPMFSTTIRRNVALIRAVNLFPVPDGDEITQEYSEQHKAWDIAAVTGSAVVAAEEGTVTYVQIWDGSYDTTGMMSYGHMIRIEHPDGNTTLYAHLSEINVQQGEKVVRGQRIGRVGSTGNSTGPHLHFEVMSETGKKENPEPVLEYGVSTLLDDYTWSWVNQYLNRPNGTKTISDYGVTRDKVVAELTSHQSDNYYLGTTYVGGDSQSPKGDTSYNGSVGMNCAGFVSYVLCKLGLNAGTSDLNNHTALPANSVQGLMTKAVGGRSADWYSSYKSRNLLAGASNYCFWIANGDLKSYA